MVCIRDWHSKSVSNVRLNEKDQLPSRVRGSYGNWSKCGEEVIFLMDSVFFKLHDCWQLLALGHVLRDVPESVFLTRGLAEPTRTSQLAWSYPGYQSRQRETVGDGPTLPCHWLCPPRSEAEGISGGFDAAPQHLDPSVLPLREHARQLLGWAWHWWC